MFMNKILLLIFAILIGGWCLAAEDLLPLESPSANTQEKPKTSRFFVGAKINPHYKIDCRKSSNTYDPYYCGLRNSPEVVKFSAPRPGVTFTF